MIKKQINLEKNIKLKVLDLIKKYVRENGWSSDIFDKINKNFKKSELISLFPGGIYDVLSFVYEDLNNKVYAQIRKSNIINLSLNKIIKKILITRIDLMNKDKKFYKKTFFYLILNSRKKFAKKTLYKTVDDIWFLAGDNSTDFNFYTKRLILAGIYVNALIVYFNKNITEAEINIDKNLNRISKLPNIKKRFSFLKDNLPIIMKSIFN